MDLPTNNPDQYAKTWFYITFVIVALYALVVFTFVFRH